LRFRLKYETRGFDEYINIYDEKNKLSYYSVQVDYARPKRLLYNKNQERLTVIDFGTDDIEDLLEGYPIYVGGEKIGHFDDSCKMDSTQDVEFAHVVGPEWCFIDKGERLTFRDYVIEDEKGGTIMKMKRSGHDFVCDIAAKENAVLALSLASVEFWRFITTTREY